MKAKCRQLYYEKRGGVSNQVKVGVRQWTRCRDDVMGDDTVLHKIVWVDGDKIIDNRVVLDADNSQSQHIRDAIKTFDTLLNAHPTLSKDAR